MNYQKLIIVGNATNDSKRQISEKGDVSYTTFSIRVGDGKGHTTYFPVVTFGKLGEIADKYVTQGLQLLVEGRIQVNKKDRFNLIADKVILGTRPSPIDSPPGCPFHPRCFAKVGKICEENYPPFFDVGEQRVACWIYDEAT